MTPSGRWVDPFAGMAGRRLFVAAPLPDAAAAEVAAIVETVRSQPLPDGMRDVRWVRLDGLHLTLRFLGPAADERIAPTAAAMHAAAAGCAPFGLTIAGSGTFPPGPRPRTIWLGLTDGTSAMTKLAETVGDALVGAGWPPDGRPFRAHLTLARCDGLAAGPLVAGRLTQAMADRAIVADIERIGLFESVTGGGPARYVPIDAAPLRGAPVDGDSVYHPT